MFHMLPFVCNKLMSLNINPYVINWIVSFLSNRKQRVVVDGFVTEFVSINRGVAQGTVLGPILFSIMVNDIRPVYPECNLLLKYADGLTLSIPVSAHQDHSLIEVNSIQHWAVRNRMKLNLTKTREMVVHGRISKPLPPLVQGIERKSWLKLLAIIFRGIHRIGTFMLTICYAKLVVIYTFYAFVNILDTLKSN